jgi:cytosine/adenosine deaminase-related metal-dependent hydrolase
MLRPTRYSARWLLPVTSPPVAGGAVLVGANGRIEAAGPTESVPLPDGAADIDLGDAALLPGLINAHTHLDLTFARGLLEDLPFTDWIAALLRARRSAHLSDDDQLAAARLGCAESIAAGITTTATTEDSDAGFDALLECGMRGLVYREVFGPDPEQCADSMEALRGRIAAMRTRATDRVRIGISPHAPYSVSDKLFEAVARYAVAELLPVAVHAAESAAESALVSEGAGVFGERLRARGIATPVRAASTIALLERTGILDLAPLLIHAIRLSPDDIERIARSGACVVHCPAANARLGHGVAPIDALRHAGVTVALGTDSVGSNNRVDILEEAHLAQMLQRATTADATCLPAEDLLRMATLDGARVLGLDDVTGSIETGKAADLCAIRLDGANVRPVNDVLAAIIHAARASDVILTVVEGRVLFRDGRVLTIDSRAAGAAVDDIAGRVRAGLAASGPAEAPAS